MIMWAMPVEPAALLSGGCWIRHLRPYGSPSGLLFSILALLYCSYGALLNLNFLTGYNGRIGFMLTAGFFLPWLLNSSKKSHCRHSPLY